MIPQIAHSGQSALDVIKSDLLPNFFWHVMVTFPVISHGILAGHLLFAPAVLTTWPAIQWFKKRNQLAPFLMYVFPAVFMLGFHGFVSVNPPRYNEILIASYALLPAIWLAICFSKKNTEK